MPDTPKTCCLYLRVSTSEQNTDMQRDQLMAVADRAGWRMVEVYEDAGVSGSKGRDKRPAFDKMLKDATRRKFDVVMAWSVDRLGRSLSGLIETLADLQKVGVDLFLNQQALDTTTPSGRAMFQMLGVFAEWEREMLRGRVNAGLARARSHGTKSGEPIGRPSISIGLVREIEDALARGMTLDKAASRFDVGRGTVARIRYGTHPNSTKVT